MPKAGAEGSMAASLGHIRAMVTKQCKHTTIAWDVKLVAEVTEHYDARGARTEL